MAELTQETLKTKIRYEPETGLFYRRDSNAPCGYKGNQRGYIKVSISGKEYRAHRLAWFYMYGEWPSGPIDHVNHVTNDNRWSNLRLASVSLNQANRYATPFRTVQAKGVWRTPNNTFCARLFKNAKMYYGGVHCTHDEAAHAYNKLAIQHFGEFACLNPIGVDYE
jgi:hypothetical protein